MRGFLIAAGAIAGLAVASSALAADTTQLYFNDFTAAPTAYSGVTASITGGGGVTAIGGGAAGFTGNVFRNATGDYQVVAPTATLFTLSNLPTHDHITIDFDLAFIDSWDGPSGDYAPDLLMLSIDGVGIGTMSSLNCRANSFSPGAVGGSTSAFGNFTGIIDPFDSACFKDRIVDMTGAAGLTFAHTGSTLILSIVAGGSGFQGGDDESWGLDNFSVAANLVSVGNPVPEPATWAMMIGGFAGMGAMLRRRRTAAVA